MGCDGVTLVCWLGGLWLGSVGMTTKCMIRSRARVILDGRADKQLTHAGVILNDLVIESPS